jgi:hypothetical protein
VDPGSNHDRNPEFVKAKQQTIQLLKRLLGGKPGLLDKHGKEIFATATGS